jgi:uroporphyrin-III C-methyltransferase/precorrin-2 dehydrogenase/sirohydrochlorin ferrochelatase
MKLLKKNKISQELKKTKYTDKTLPVLLCDPKVLLVGGGKVALQKAKVLKSNNIDFQIITTSIDDELKSLGVNYKIKKLKMHDIKSFNFVIDATGDKKVNTILKNSKRRKFFLLNSVDFPEECDFYFSSLLQYNNLKIAISSDGASPTLTQIVRERIRKSLPPKLGDLAKKKLSERIENIVDIEKTKKEAAALFGKVFLVGCGPGSIDNLTLRALNVIQTADIILYDYLIGHETLIFAKSDAQIYCVGKEKGHHKFKQEEINKIMLRFAEAGYTVARLKGGDPYVFGRGAEEAEFLIDNNVDVEVIPGISSATSAPLLAGIPLTHRNFSSGFSVVTAHCKEDKNFFEWLDFLKIKNHTTIVLMGLTRVEEILMKGIEAGVDDNLPIAIISNASKGNQKVLTSKFKNITEIARQAEKPAVLIFGDVVNLHKKLFFDKGEKMKSIT